MRAARASRRWRCPPRAGSAWSWLSSRRAAVEREVERRAVIDAALCPDLTTVAMQDALNARQANPGAGELGDGVQPLERNEQLVGERHVEPGAVVAHEERPAIDVLG